jgi:hypothetical protein
MKRFRVFVRRQQGDKRKYKKDLLKNEGLIWLIILTILVAEYHFILEEKE